MIAAAYMVLTICKAPCFKRYSGELIPMAAVTIPQPTMDQCIRQATAINTKRKDVRAMCVPGAEK